MNDRPLSDFDATVLGQMGHIRAVGRNRLRNQNELDDFVQETIARAYANRDQLRDPREAEAVDRRHRAEHGERVEPRGLPQTRGSASRRRRTAG